MAGVVVPHSGAIVGAEIQEDELTRLDLDAQPPCRRPGHSVADLVGPRRHAGKAEAALLVGAMLIVMQAARLLDEKDLLPLQGPLLPGPSRYPPPPDHCARR